MNYTRNLLLFGSMAARNHAKCLLENDPHVIRIDSDDRNMQFKLILSAPMPDMKLLSLLKDCELSGVQLMG